LALSGGRISSNFLINSKASQFAILAEATQLFFGHVVGRAKSQRMLYKFVVHNGAKIET